MKKVEGLEELDHNEIKLEDQSLYEKNWRIDEIEI